MDPNRDSIFDDISKLATEQSNPLSENIDSASVEEILRVINEEDKLVPRAVEKELKYIEKAVELIVESIKRVGRLFYFGAGTSGRLGILDAVECPPTFGTPPDLIKGFIAGGNDAVFKAVEGAEDSEQNGADDLIKAGVNEKDVVCGIAASRRTPYVIGAVKKAKELGAATLFVTTNPRESFIFQEADISICPFVGPEVIMGSTRMKSGTAQKLVLNMLTTASMIRLGKVYGNMMIDLQLTNNKLKERARRIIMIITGIDYETAGKYLADAGGHVKTALVMILAKVSRDEAVSRLTAADGFVKRAIE
jgi:N-acetylmuramic acid 6-phosphate etherase